MNVVGLLFLILNVAEASTLLRVRPHVVVAANSQVQLKQIVDSQAFSPTLQAALDQTALVRAPESGEQLQLSRAEVMELLRPLIQEERQRTGAAIQVVIPNAITLDTVKRQLSAELVSEELLKVWQPLCIDCRLELEALSVPKVIAIRDYTLKPKAELPKGSFSVPIELVKEDGSPAAAWVSGRLVVKRLVPIAKRVINMQERLQSQDVAWEFQDTSFAVDGIPTQDEIVGKTLKQGVRAGQVVWRSQLEKEKAIRRGDLVVVRSGSKEWEVSMNVIAQQDGHLGDIVNVKNPKTNNILIGQVTGQGEVELR